MSCGIQTASACSNLWSDGVGRKLRGREKQKRDLQPGEELTILREVEINAIDVEVVPVSFLHRMVWTRGAIV